MQVDIRELIEALKHCADPEGLCNDCTQFDPVDEDCECLRALQRKAADALEGLLNHINSKDIIIENLNDNNKLLRDANARLTSFMKKTARENHFLKKENKVLWKKQTPLSVEVRELDEEFDIKTKHCPNCGVRLVKWGQCGLNYCSECGQALKFGAGSTETDRPGGWSLPDDDTEIGMIANINDRM